MTYLDDAEGLTLDSIYTREALLVPVKMRRNITRINPPKSHLADPGRASGCSKNFDLNRCQRKVDNQTDPATSVFKR
ncbi:MAG: hypothetical protein ACI8UP_003538 [Porticoccaceae bacterium]